MASEGMPRKDACHGMPKSLYLGTPSVKMSISSLRVTKKLSTTSRGALKLARQFGDALVCVRHRIDEKGECRYTTVELLVDTATIRPRAEHVVGVRIGASERSLQTVVRAAGATWDYKAKLWRMPAASQVSCASSIALPKGSYL